MSSSKNAYSKKELLNGIVELKNQIGETPSAYKMDKLGAYSTGPYYRQWDSWYEALNDAGLEPTKLSNNNRKKANYIRIKTNNNGHRELRHTISGERYYVMMHRLHATLLVEDVSELEGKIVHHKNGCTFDNRLPNYEIVSKKKHRDRHPPDGGDKYKTLCRGCDVANLTVNEPTYCPECGSLLEECEVEKSDPIDWSSFD